jgi:hypothetical protein
MRDHGPDARAIHHVTWLPRSPRPALNLALVFIHEPSLGEDMVLRAGWCATGQLREESSAVSKFSAD